MEVRPIGVYPLFRIRDLAILYEVKVLGYPKINNKELQEWGFFSYEEIFKLQPPLGPRMLLMVAESFKFHQKKKI